VDEYVPKRLNMHGHVKINWLSARMLILFYKIDQDNDTFKPYGDAAEILSEYIGRKISYVNISEDDARRLIKEMGISDWHTNILLELLKLSRDGYLSNISHAVE
jgi:hypothetical protein